MLDERFFRNPHFQLRDLGASSPDGSFSQKVASSKLRHPVMVVGVEPCAFAFAAESMASGFVFNSAAGVLTDDSGIAALFTIDSAGELFADSPAAAGVLLALASAGRVPAATGSSGVFDVATIFGVSRRPTASALSGFDLACVCASAFTGGVSGDCDAAGEASALRDDPRAVISTPSAAMKIATRTKARRARSDVVDGFSRGRFFAFLSGADSLRNERVWNFGFAESRYRIDRVGLFVFFAGTEVLLGDPPSLGVWVVQARYPQRPVEGRP